MTPAHAPLLFETVAFQGACWLVMVLVVFAIIILLDVWRIEPKYGDALTKMVLVVLANVLLLTGVLFARCSWVGRMESKIEIPFYPIDHKDPQPIVLTKTITFDGNCLHWKSEDDKQYWQYCGERLKIIPVQKSVLP